VSTLSWYVAVPAGFFATLGSQGSHNYEGVGSGLWVRSATADRELHLHVVRAVLPEWVTDPYLYTAGNPYGPLLVFKPWTMAVLEHCSPTRPEYLGPARSLLTLHPRVSNVRAPRRGVIV
jgi:hypothetical protein